METISVLTGFLKNRLLYAVYEGLCMKPILNGCPICVWRRFFFPVHFGKISLLQLDLPLRNMSQKLSEIPILRGRRAIHYFDKVEKIKCISAFWDSHEFRSSEREEWVWYRRSFYGLKRILCEDFLVMISVLWSKFRPFETIEGPCLPGSFWYAHKDLQELRCIWNFELRQNYESP